MSALDGLGPHWISAPGAGELEWLGDWLPVSVLAILVLGILAAVLKQGLTPQPSQPRRWTGKSRGLRNVVSLTRRPIDRKIDLAAEQMRAVEASSFERKPLLNREEAKILPLLERMVRESGKGYRVMAQTSLGEVIRPRPHDNFEAFGAINSKRLDFAIFDSRGLIVCAIEYQGTGHYQAGAAFRDTVKREALRKAGVRLIELHPGFAETRLAEEVDALLGGR